MKCPMCGGDGITDKFTPNVGRCIKCNGSGEFEPTNEEWFCGLSTEEKADKLTDFSFWLVPTIPTDEKREQVKRKIVEWLKEIHHAE